METYYLAYGSNLNLRQMAYRCPTARVVGSTVLGDYKLVFRGRTGNAVATVEPCTGSNVPCLVWQIRPEDERSLDCYEGYPTLYRKEWVSVMVCGQPQKVMVYIMNDRYPVNKPSPAYLNTIREGYHSAGFDENFLIKAAGGRHE